MRVAAKGFKDGEERAGKKGWELSYKQEMQIKSDNF